MEKELNNDPIRSSKSFHPKEKAYHVYQFELQKHNYGISAREHARQHNILKDTLRFWIERYPHGLPYYNADDPVEPMEELRDEEPQMIVKLSKSQINDSNIESKRESSADGNRRTVRIKYCSAELEVSTEDLQAVLVAIRSVNDLNQ